MYSYTCRYSRVHLSVQVDRAMYISCLAKTNRPVQILLHNLSECTSGQLTTHNLQLTTHNLQPTHNSQLQVVLMGDAAHTMTPILWAGPQLWS